MFTGIVEEVGELKSISAGTLEVKASLVTDDLNIGDSVSVNGVCLTAVSCNKAGFTADLSPETYARSALKYLKQGSPVNLERAMKLDSRFGGHIVQGHVDTTAKILNIDRESLGYTFTIELPADIRDLVAEKGSIAVNGISLTVATDLTDAFTVAIIPHTFEHTALSKLKSGEFVNLEADLFARYTRKLLGASANTKNEERLKALLLEL